jgi:hypothetical protein
MAESTLDCFVGLWPSLFLRPDLANHRTPESNPEYLPNVFEAALKPIK